MGTESIEASFLSIFALISFFIFLLISKYSHKIRGGALLDKDFLKPQAFHDFPVTRSGGIAVIISLSVFFVIYYLLYSKILYNYILVSYSVFFVGFLVSNKLVGKNRSCLESTVTNRSFEGKSRQALKVRYHLGGG